MQYHRGICFLRRYGLFYWLGLFIVICKNVVIELHGYKVICKNVVIELHGYKVICKNVVIWL